MCHSTKLVGLRIYRFFVGLGIGGEIAVGGVVLANIDRPERRWALAVMQTSFGAGCLLCSLCNLSTGSLWLALAIFNGSGSCIYDTLHAPQAIRVNII